MKRIVTLVALLMLVLATIVIAAPPQMGETDEGESQVPIILPEMKEWKTIYHYDMGSADGRELPNYEYTFAGDMIHFGAKIADSTIYNVENEVVTVIITCPVTTEEVVLQKESPTWYNPATGKYEAWYEGDFVTPEADVVSGLCTLSVNVTNPTGGSILDMLTLSNYETMNDLLINPEVTMTFGDQGLSFTLNVNQWNRALNYPIPLSVNTIDDREGQGVIGNLSLAATNLVGVHFPEDIVYARDIRFHTSTGYRSIPWTSLYSNLVLSTEPWPITAPACAVTQTGDATHTCWTELEFNAATDGVGYNNQLFFEIWYGAEHMDTTYRGGSLGVLYQIH